MNTWMVLAEKETSSLDDLSPWPRVGLFALELDQAAVVGDRVILWRRAPIHGVIAIGVVAEGQWATEDRHHTRALVRVVLDKLLLSCPIRATELVDSRLGVLARQASNIATARYHRTIRSGRIWLPDHDFEALISLADNDRQVPLVGPSAWALRPGDTLDRAEVHQTYGGERSRSACFARHSANALVFVPTTEADGLWRSWWESDVLVTPVDEQRRDTSARVHHPVLHHVEHGSPLRVFRTVDTDRCTYLGEFVIDHEGPILEWRDTRIVEYHGGHHYQHALPIFRLRYLDGSMREPSGADVTAWGRDVGLRVSVVQRDAADNAARPSAQANQLRFDDMESLTPSAPDDRDLPAALQRLAAAVEADPDVAETLSRLQESELVASLVQQAHRRRDLDTLESLVLDEETDERALQTCLEKMTWVFGGEFLSAPARRGLHVQHQMDLTLVRPDSSLHVVELKLARVPAPIVRERNGWVLGAAVSRSIGQARNYLVALDENRHQILNDLGLDTRRASVTIVVSHSAFLSPDLCAGDVAETLRRNNAHDPRVTVLTYDQLIANARRALTVAAPTPNPPMPLREQDDS
ncbi:Shedu anti-phage system protein SduA domain-containing protein [Nocardia heshunensis]